MRCSFWTALICWALHAPAGAVIVAPLTFDELVNASAVIVDARVSHVAGQWSDDRSRIDSVVTVDVMGRFKGAPGGTMSFTIPGGRVGRYVNLIPGGPAFTAGDRAVVFLASRGPRLPTLTGFTQGIYRVTVDSRTGSMLVVPPVVDSPEGRIPRGDVRRKPVSMAAFEAAVRRVSPVVR